MACRALTDLTTYAAIDGAEVSHSPKQLLNAISSPDMIIPVISLGSKALCKAPDVSGKSITMPTLCNAASASHASIGLRELKGVQAEYM